MLSTVCTQSDMEFTQTHTFTHTVDTHLSSYLWSVCAGGLIILAVTGAALWFVCVWLWAALRFTAAPWRSTTEERREERKEKNIHINIYKYYFRMLCACMSDKVILTNGTSKGEFLSKSTVTKPSVTVSLDGEKAHPLPLTLLTGLRQGTRQGCPHSPLLFDIWNKPPAISELKRKRNTRFNFTQMMFYFIFEKDQKHCRRQSTSYTLRIYHQLL